MGNINRDFNNEHIFNLAIFDMGMQPSYLSVLNFRNYMVLDIKNVNSHNMIELTQDNLDIVYNIKENPVECRLLFLFFIFKC